jgi:reverse transcriptase-like protein
MAETTIRVTPAYRTSQTTHTPLLSSPSLPIRKSSRISKPPSHLQDFMCSTAHWCNLVRFDSLPHTHQSFIASQHHLHEPKSYKQAVQDPLWVKAMESELTALQNNHIWELVLLPPGKKTIGCKWVYKIKLKVDGSIERYKAHLVAKGYTQEYGVDFHDIFSPVVHAFWLLLLLKTGPCTNWMLIMLFCTGTYMRMFIWPYLMVFRLLPIWCVNFVSLFMVSNRPPDNGLRNLPRLFFPKALFSLNLIILYLLIDLMILLLLLRFMWTILLLLGIIWLLYHI